MDNFKNIIKINNGYLDYYIDYRLYNLIYSDHDIIKKKRKWYNIFNF